MNQANCPTASNLIGPEPKNSYNRILITLLKGNNDPEMVKNQNIWLALQNSDKKITAGIEKGNIGTIGSPILGWHHVSMIRERIAELFFYYGGGQE